MARRVVYGKRIIIVPFVVYVDVRVLRMQGIQPVVYNIVGMAPRCGGPIVYCLTSPWPIRRTQAAESSVCFLMDCFGLMGVRK